MGARGLGKTVSGTASAEGSGGATTAIRFATLKRGASALADESSATRIPRSSGSGGGGGGGDVSGGGKGAVVSSQPSAAPPANRKDSDLDHTGGIFRPYHLPEPQKTELLASALWIRICAVLNAVSGIIYLYWR
jgi:hypothetical protein